MSAVFIPYREVFMNYAGIKEYDIANGPGIRFSLFVSGCTHHCRGCFNPDTWSFHYANRCGFTLERAKELMDLMHDSDKGTSYYGKTRHHG